MFSSKEELNELENESLTATESPFGQIIKAPSRRIYMENRFISIHTPDLSSVVLIEHLWAQHLYPFAPQQNPRLKSWCAFSVRLWM